MPTLIAVDDYINIRGLGKCAVESIPYESTLEVRQVQSGKYYLVSDLAVLARWPDTIYYGAIIHEEYEEYVCTGG